MMYIVVIEQVGEQARLECRSLEEAERVKVSFENYGRCQNIRIEQVDQEYGYSEQQGASNV